MSPKVVIPASDAHMRGSTASSTRSIARASAQCSGCTAGTMRPLGFSSRDPASRWSSTASAATRAASSSRASPESAKAPARPPTTRSSYSKVFDGTASPVDSGTVPSSTSSTASSYSSRRPTSSSVSSESTCVACALSQLSPPRDSGRRSSNPAAYVR